MASNKADLVYVFELVADVFTGNERQDVVVQDFVRAASTADVCAKVKVILNDVQAVFPNLTFRIRRIERDTPIDDEV